MRVSDSARHQCVSIWKAKNQSAGIAVYSPEVHGTIRRSDISNETEEGGLQVIIFIDGSVTGNPGGLVGFGWYCPDTEEEGNGVAYQGGSSATNNASEWMAAAAALIYVLGQYYDIVDTVTIRSDSELLVNQLNGKWRVRHSNLKPMAAIVNLLIEELESRNMKVVAEWIPREENKVADVLSRKTVKSLLKERRAMTMRETNDE